jgi:hypothetical protein
MTFDEVLSEDARVAPHLPLAETLTRAERLFGLGPQATWRQTGKICRLPFFLKLRVQLSCVRLQTSRSCLRRKRLGHWGWP